MFGQLLTAMVTPFDDEGRLDLQKLPLLVDHLLQTGTTALIVCGTTGESPTLEHDEKLELFSETVRLCRGKVPVIAGTGSNSTKESQRLTQEVEALGVDGFLLVAPYYNRPSQEGLYQHFSAVAHATDKPVILYNIPARTGVNLQVDTVVRSAEHANIIGVKESTGDFTQIANLIANTPQDFLVYSGDDKFTLPILALGGAGVVSVASHVVGSQMAEMIQAVKQGDLSRAQTLHYKLLPLFEELFRTSNPVLVKAALSMIDVPVGKVRPPLVDATVEEKRSLRRVLEKVIDLEIVH